MGATRHRYYAPFAFACVVHGAAFSALFWFGLIQIVSEPSPGIVVACYALFFTWPVWAFVLWWSCKSWFYTLFPLTLGFLAIAPSLAFLWLLSGMGRNC